MILTISIITIFFISLIAAIRSAEKELSIPHEVRNIKIKKSREGFSGVILFLKEKIIHYSSGSS